MLARTATLFQVLGGFLLLWEAGCRLFDLPTYFLPPPSIVFAELFTAPGWYLKQSFYTLITTLGGFALALAVGVVAAIGITYSKTVEKILYTLLVALNSIPKIALAPLFVIYLGTGMASKIAVSFLIAIFAIVIDTVLGLRSVDPDAVNLLRTMRASRFQELIKIRLPNALPYLFAGMKVAISLALVGAIAGEFVASQEGLGFVILSAQSLMQTTRVYAAIILLGVMGSILFYATDLLEGLICPWHVSQRTAHTGPSHS